MIRDELFPGTTSHAPPSNLDEAIQRVLNAVDMHQLVLKVFGSTHELRLALKACGYLMREPRGVLVGDQIKTYVVEIIGSDSSEFKMVVNEVGDKWMQVVNVLQTKKGISQTPEEFKAIKDVTG